MTACCGSFAQPLILLEPLALRDRSSLAERFGARCHPYSSTNRGRGSVVLLFASGGERCGPILEH